MTQLDPNNLEETRAALKKAFTEELTPKMKEFFPKGREEDIAAVVEGEFSIFDQIGMIEGTPTQEQMETICDTVGEKTDPIYVALREANGLDDLDEAEDDALCERMENTINQSFGIARAKIMQDMMGIGGAPDLQAMLMDMMTPSTPGGRVMEVGFGFFDPESGEMKETVIRPPGGFSSSDKIH